jgi:hypothetical protein
VARTSTNQYAYETLDYQRQFAPWWHPNPAYSAYLQRAKFPDVTAATLRGLVGIATKRAPQRDLPAAISYFDEGAITPDGMTLDELYAFCISEVLQVGRLSLTLDVGQDDQFYIASYSTESYVNWDTEVVNAEVIQTLAVYTHEELNSTEEGSESKSLVYYLGINEEAGSVGAYSQKYTDSEPDGDGVELSYKGKPFTRLPIVNLGSIKNDPVPDTMPLLGVSDCALDNYRHSADLGQAHFQTCNPTLVFTGIDADEAPQIVGSTISIGMSNPSAKAFYPATDTSALSHVSSHMEKTLQEAAAYGAALLA